MDLLDVTGGKLAVYVEGEGPAVIFLHGGPGDTHDYMKRMAEPLFRNYTCIFFDQRGSGNSLLNLVNPDQFKLELLFDDLLRICSHCGLKEATLVGHSWGAMYALFASMAHPDIFRKAALLNIGPLDREAEIKAGEGLMGVFSSEDKQKWLDLRDQRSQASEQGFVALVQKIDKELMSMRVQSWIYNPELRPIFLDQYFKDPPTNREVNKLIWEQANSGWFSWDKVTYSQSKVWILAGENDFLPVSQSQKLEKFLPHGKLSIFEECGHIPWLEKPQRFYNELKSFLSEK